MADVIAVIRRNADGATCDYRYEVEDQYADGQHFWWEDGNASCDCNRALFFGDCTDSCPEGEPFKGCPIHPCGDEAYTLVSLTVSRP